MLKPWQSHVLELTLHPPNWKRQGHCHQILPHAGSVPCGRINPRADFSGTWGLTLKYFSQPRMWLWAHHSTFFFFLATPYDLWDLSFPKPLGSESTNHWATRKIPTTQLSHSSQSAQERTHWGVERRPRSQDTKELSMFLFLVLRKQSTALKWSAS